MPIVVEGRGVVRMTRNRQLEVTHGRRVISQAMKDEAEIAMHRTTIRS